MRLLSLIRWPRSLVAFAVVLITTLVVAYATFCDRVGCLAEADVGTRVLLCGSVISSAEAEMEIAYEIEDRTGHVFVLTSVGAPSKGAIVLVWGTKMQTDTGRAIVKEHKRVGSF